MKMNLPLVSSDLLLLKNAAIVFLVLSGLSVLFVVGASAMQTSSTQNLAEARANYEQVVTSVTQIAQEEETIIQYIDRYRRLERDGIINAEDRLALLEKFTSIREQYRLYPMQIAIEEQVSYELPYPPEDPMPGELVNLQQSIIDITMPLLHEGDLLRTMDAVMQLPAFLQPVVCVMERDLSGLNATNQLRENLTSRCRLHWYTFNLNPIPDNAEDGL